MATALATALLVISVFRLAVDLGSTASSLDLARSALNEPIWRSRLGLNAGLFILSLTFLHLAFGVFCWLLARASESVLLRIRCSRRDWILIWYVASVAWILIANATYFPKSSLGEPYQELVDASLFGITPHVVATFVMLSGLAIVLLLTLRNRTVRRISLAAAGVAAISIVTGLSGDMIRPADSSPERPHIILLGIDSLRPDAIDAQTTPNLHAFMGGAVRMTDAITPLARTFPSWVSILTGRHPHTTGAYMNLLPRERIHEGVTLPEILREHGYRTYYAIDETRFSNIDASYGFDRTVTPIMGGSDFLLARIADTPLSNLVANTWIGAVLFPHIHANRAANVVYDPDTFVRRVGRELDFRQPGFLAVHLTLPHWPYTWATSETDRYRSSMDDLYREAVRRADQQFGDLLALLARRGVLDNALVIALSDHGEALGHADDFMADAFPGKDKEVTEYQRWGHGTSVFSPHQYRVTLGFRAYGMARPRLSAAGVRTEPVSLIDLAPTILDLLEIAPGHRFDGISLGPLLLPGASAPHAFADRIRFTESEYNPQGFDPREFSTSQLSAAAQVYRLDPSTDRLTVRTELLDTIMSSRQYAAILGNRALGAAVPGPGDHDRHQFVYVRTVESAAEPGDAKRLRAALQEGFGIEMAGTL